MKTLSQFLLKPLLTSIFAIALSLGLLVACVPATLATEPPPVPAPRLPGLDSSAIVTLVNESVYYEVGGPKTGSPVVLVHAIGGGNSSHLWRENTAALAKTHRVYTFDWPGFARSGAKAQLYTNDLYVQVLEQFLREVVGQPSAVIAGNIGSDYTIRVAAEHPELITRMILANPNGYDVNGVEDRSDRFALAVTSARNLERYKLFTETPVGFFTFGALHSDDGLNFFLYNYVYLDKKRVTPELTKIYYDNLSGPNKQYAPFSFFSGFLEQPVAGLWEKTTQPTLLVWAPDDVFSPIRYAEKFMEVRRDVPLKFLTGRAIPYDEDFERFNEIALEFLK
jgi:pimeloyl-ACP methyl ester carboxylesterase